MFYDHVKSLCQEKNIKMTSLARKLGLSPSSPSRWESGSIPRGDTLQKIADYFGVTTDYLLNGDERITNNNSGNISGSSIVIGNRAQTINSNVGAPSGNSESLTEQEAELLRIFRSVGVRKQTQIMSFVFEIEEQK